jgi:hypothetical protein
MSSIKKPSNKTRNLSFFQLFEVLQEEYIVCGLRVEIYPHQKHKDFWIETMSKKKERILEISKRNFLPCIFDDNRIMASFVNKIIPKIGYPKFVYRDSNHQLIQEKWDRHNYYSVNADVSVMDETGSVKLGTIVKVNFDTSNAEIKIRDSEAIQLFDFETITRILVSFK